MSESLIGKMVIRLKNGQLMTIGYTGVSLVKKDGEHINDLTWEEIANHVRKAQ